MTDRIAPSTKFKEGLINLGKDVSKEMKSIYSNLRPEVDIVQIAREYDKRHRKTDTLLAPLSIELNNIIGFYPPIGEYKLRYQDLVSVTVSQKYGEAKAKCAMSRSMTEGGKHEIIAACNEACIAAIKECGVDVRMGSLRLTISEILESHGVSTLTDVCGYDLYDPLRVIPNTKKIPNFFSDRNYYKLSGEKMRDGDVLYIDVYGTDTAFDQRACGYQYPLLFHRSEKKKELKLKSDRNMLTYINRMYKKELFSLREITEDYPVYLFKTFPKNHIGRHGPRKFPESIFKKLMKEELINSYPTAELRDETEKQKVHNNVAHIGHTVYIDEQAKGGWIYVC